MGQILHGSATTTEAIRRAIQDSEESLRALAKRYGINQKTVAKWKKRSSVADVPTGPKNPSSTVLTIEEEAVIVAFRRHPLLPLDEDPDRFYLEPASALTRGAFAPLPGWLLSNSIGDSAARSAEINRMVSASEPFEPAAEVRTRLIARHCRRSPHASLEGLSKPGVLRYL